MIGLLEFQGEFYCYSLLAKKIIVRLMENGELWTPIQITNSTWAQKGKGRSVAPNWGLGRRFWNLLHSSHITDYAMPHLPQNKYISWELEYLASSKLGLWIGTGPLPVRNWAAQMAGERVSKASSMHAQNRKLRFFPHWSVEGNFSSETGPWCQKVWGALI